MEATPTKIRDVTVAIADDQPTFWARVAAGTWEPGTLAVLGDLLKEGVLFVDLGAWVGPTTLYAAAKGARVIAVEADEAALAQLDRNLAANPDLARNISVIRRAVHATGGQVTLGVRRKPGDSMSSLLLSGAPLTWTVETVTPAELSRHAGPADRVVVKIDIEGAEYDLVSALGPLIGRQGTAVIVSFHPRILAETRPGMDVTETTRRALAAFRGWQAYAVRDGGAEWRGNDAGALADHPGGLDGEEWLFIRP